MSSTSSGSTKGHVALIRGINVGGKNPVAMADLRAAFEECGFDNVSTYIQSGNVLFYADAKPSELGPQIEAAMEARFGVPLMVVVRTHRQLADVVHQAPQGFGAQPDTYHSDAVFLRSPLTPAEAMKVVRLRDGVDAAWPGKGVIYFQRLSARRTQSHMSKIIGTVEYKSMTMRSWNTTTKLLARLETR